MKTILQKIKINNFILILTFTALTLLPSTAMAANLTLALPEVNYEYWRIESVNLFNNCYNYATNRAEGSWAQPGEASNAKYKTFSCEAIYAAASQDWGLTPTKYFSLEENKEETLIALVVNPGTDFHWYRRGSNNKWSHKLTFEVYETDSSGNIITDPVTADRGRYSDFCGYFKVKNYLANSQEQNAGYVRIGKMTDWPQYTNLDKAEKKSPIKTLTEESKVIHHIFSGRQNPIFSLQRMLKDPVAAEILTEVSKLIKDALLLSEKNQNNLELFRPDLGTSSIFIIDSEGIIFPRESVIVFREKFIKITLKNKRPVILESSMADELRNYLMNLELI